MSLHRVDEQVVVIGAYIRFRVEGVLSLVFALLVLAFLANVFREDPEK